MTYSYRADFIVGAQLRLTWLLWHNPRLWAQVCVVLHWKLRITVKARCEGAQRDPQLEGTVDFGGHALCSRRIRDVIHMTFTDVCFMLPNEEHSTHICATFTWADMKHEMLVTSTLKAKLIKTHLFSAKLPPLKFNCWSHFSLLFLSFLHSSNIDASYLTRVYFAVSILK